MMNPDSESPGICPDRAGLEQFLEELLPPEEQSAVGDHVNHCGSCQTLLDEILNTREISMRTPEISPDDAKDSAPWMSGVLERIRRQSGPRVSEMTALDFPGSTPSMSKSGGLRFPEQGSTPGSPGRLDEFEICRLIDSGATGHVFEAFDTRLNRTVAIKVLRAELCASEQAQGRFTREAQAIARLNNAHIVSIHDVRQPSNFPPYIVMEFIRGHSLAMLMSEGRFSIERSVDILCQMLQALAEAHQAGVIHRDVKPGNILVEESSGEIRLVDFGLARLQEGTVNLTSDMNLAGTPAYMSPEQILNAHNVDVRSDVYSAGVVMYELLTGEVPFQGSIRMVLQQVMHDEPASLRSLDDRIPRDLQTVCLKSMSKVPLQRYASATRFFEDLQRWKQGLPVLARPVGFIGRSVRWCHRNPSTARLIGLVGLLIFAMIGIWVRFTLQVTEARNGLAEMNTQISAANAKLKQANQVAETERRQSDRQANLAFRALNRITFGVQDSLKEQPELRQRLLRESIPDLNALAAEVHPGSSMSVSLTAAYLRLGDNAVESGDFALADECARLAEQAIQRVPDEDRLNPDVLQCSVWLHLIRSRLALMKSDWDKVVQEARSATEISGQILRIQPDRTDTLHARSFASLLLADVAANPLGQTGVKDVESDDILFHYNQAIVALSRCCEISPTELTFKTSLASALLKRAAFLAGTNPGIAAVGSAGDPNGNASPRIAALTAAVKNAEQAHQLLTETCQDQSAISQYRLEWALAGVQLAEYRSSLNSAANPSRPISSAGDPENQRMIANAEQLLQDLEDHEPENERVIYGLARCAWWRAIEAERRNQHEVAHGEFQNALHQTIRSMDAANVRRPELAAELSQMFVVMSEIELRRGHNTSIEEARNQVAACVERMSQRALINNDEAEFLRRRILSVRSDTEN